MEFYHLNLFKYPCMHHAESRKIWNFFLKMLPLWLLKCLQAVSFTHDKQDCSAVLLGDTFSRKFCWITLGKYFTHWEMQLCSVATRDCRLSLKVCGVTAVHTRKKRGYSIILPCPFLAVFWMWYLVRESWFTSPLCCCGEDFSLQPKTGISECQKCCPVRHFIVVASPYLLWMINMWYKILYLLGHNNLTFQENALGAIRNTCNIKQVLLWVIEVLPEKSLSCS